MCPSICLITKVFLTLSQTFLRQFRPDLTSDAATHFKLEHIDGGQNPQDGSQAGAEAVSIDYLLVKALVYA